MRYALGLLMSLSLLTATMTAARAQGPTHSHTHEVTAEAPTLGHIASQLYGRYSYWRKIAAWNHLEPPYVIKPGQRLVLKLAPGVERLPASAPETKIYYVVDEFATTPGEIGLRLYGKPSMWKKILKWNRIESPTGVRLGRKLVIREKPTLTEEEGNQQLLAMWQRLHDRAKSNFRKRQAMAMISKLGGSPPSEVAKEPEVSKPESPKKEEVKIEKYEATESAEAVAPAPAPEPIPSAVPAAPVVLEEPKQAEPVVAVDPETGTILQAEETPQSEPESAPNDAPPVKSAASLFNEGEEAFKSSDYETALARFKESRGMDSETLPVWFYEIKTLRALNRETEARKVAKALLKKRPELGQLPILAKLLGTDSQRLPAGD
jgi:hypothetical protein